MHYSADPMFPGDLFEAAARFASDVSVGTPRLSAWQQAVEMSWPSLFVAQSYGGAGGTLADLGAVLEASARQGLGLPLVRRCVQAPALLVSTAANEQASKALKLLCAGELDIDVAETSDLQVMEKADGNLTLSGRIERVDAGLAFTHVLVSTAEHLLLLPHALLPAASARYVGIDDNLCADFTVQDLQVPSTSLLASGELALAAAQVAQDLAALATAIEMAAALGAVTEHCIAHLSTRVQFGVTLSSFQVLRHRVVDLYVAYLSASVLLSRLVQDSVDKGRLAQREAALCKLYLNTLARKGAEDCIQLHGGMGLTAELPASRLVRRLLCAQFDHGDHQFQLQRLQQ
jgi:alkylation response protein AidB-like acyl-CoA dehydrogenase